MRDISGMGDMGDMHDHAMTLLPGGLGIAFGVVSLLVVVPHLRHVASTAGQHRWWHAGHIVMALGMVQMFLLGMGNPGVDNAMGGLFIAIAFTVLVVAVWCRTREGVVNPLWIATALDMAAMAYMYAPQGLRPAPVTWLVIAYLLVQAIAWATGAWGRVPVFALEPAAVPTGTGGGGGDPASVVAAGEGAALTARLGVGLSGRNGPGVRATLTVMALLMAYMLLAMV